MKNDQVRPIFLELIKKTNYKSILLLIEEKTKISRTEIASITSLSPATVTNACEVLIKHGLVMEVSRGFSRGGRRPIFLEINPDAGDIVSVSVRKSRVRVVISNLKCEIVSSRIGELEAGADAEETAVRLIAEEIRERGPKNIVGMGIALDAEYDAEAGRSVPVHRIDPERIKNRLHGIFGFPVILENRANLCAIAEYAFYYENRIGDLIYLDLDDEVTAGILMRGNILKNERGLTSDVGHLHFRYSHRTCVCGKNGCVHEFFSMTSVRRRAIDGVVSGQSRLLAELCGHDLNGIDERVILQAALRQDGFTLQLLEEYVDNLVVLLEHLVHLFHPGAVVLGGKFASFKKAVAGILAEKIGNCPVLKDVVVDFSHYKENAAVKGASKAALLHSLSTFEAEEST